MDRTGGRLRWNARPIPGQSGRLPEVSRVEGGNGDSGECCHHAATSRSGALSCEATLVRLATRIQQGSRHVEIPGALRVDPARLGAGPARGRALDAARVLGELRAHISAGLRDVVAGSGLHQARPPAKAKESAAASEISARTVGVRANYLRSLAR
jgi:hypothetical protein